MKNILYIVIGMLITMTGFSQIASKYKELDQALEYKAIEVDQAYKLIKQYRDNINRFKDFPYKDSIVEIHIEKVYNELFDEFKQLKHKAYVFEYDEELSLESVCTINECRKRMDNSNKHYELRLFYVDFIILRSDVFDPNISKLVNIYNKKLNVVGKRMGRLIQKAIIEDRDYVTPTSFNRLNMALMELQMAENDLRYEYKHAVKIDDIHQDIEYLFKKRKESTHYITGIFDNKNSYGFGFLYSKELDYGMDIMYAFDNKQSIVLHPKVGVGEGLFHFAVGGLYFINRSTVEISGNFIIVNENYMGGISFSQNRLMFNLGVNIDDLLKKHSK